MVNLIKVKICKTISHVEVSIYLLLPSRKRQSGKLHEERDNSDNREEPPPNKVKATRLVQPYSTELKNIFDIPMKEDNNPGINRIFELCAVYKYALIHNLVPQEFM